MINWEIKESMYSHTLVGKLGKYQAFSIFWDSGTSRGEDKKYKLTCSLNGIKSNLGNFVSESEAKNYAETKIVPLWLKGSGLMIKEG